MPFKAQQIGIFMPQMKMAFYPWGLEGYKASCKRCLGWQRKPIFFAHASFFFYNWIRILVNCILLYLLKIRLEHRNLLLEAGSIKIWFQTTTYTHPLWCAETAVVCGLHYSGRHGTLALYLSVSTLHQHWFFRINGWMNENCEWIFKNRSN